MAKKSETAKAMMKAHANLGKVYQALSDALHIEGITDTERCYIQEAINRVYRAQSELNRGANPPPEAPSASDQRRLAAMAS